MNIQFSVPCKSDPNILIHIGTESWAKKKETLADIRQKVFIEEQGVSTEEEWDDADTNSETTHLLVSYQEQGSEKKMIAGTARVLKSGKIGRVAILKEYRNKGIGAQLVRTATIIALTQFNKAHLDAQIASLNFYTKLNYCAKGEVFLDANIEHKYMFFENDYSNRKTLFLSLFNDQVIRPNRIELYIFHCCNLIPITQRSIDILSKNLDKTLYSNEKIVEHISHFSRNNRNSKVRVLIEAPLNKISHYHSLITLAKRLSSKIEFKRLEKNHELKGQSYILFDLQHLVYFNDEDSMNGFINYNAKAEVKHYKEEFEYLWNKRSNIDNDFRILSI